MRWLARRLALCAGTLIALPASGSAQDPQVMVAVQRTFAALDAGDAGVALSQYMPNARVFVEFGPLLELDLPAWLAMAEGIEWNAAEMESRVLGATAITVAEVSGTLRLPQGVLEGPFRYSESRVRSGDTWLILQQQISALRPRTAQADPNTRLPNAPLVAAPLAPAPLDAAPAEGRDRPVAPPPAQESAHDASAPSARAVRVQVPPTIDGVLDEAAWMSAPPATEFFQLIPDEGQPITQDTEVRFLYDDDNIYVGAWMWDEGEVQARLSRRDIATPDADYFVVHFDSYHDHRTAYRFAVSPAGNHRDEIVTGSRGPGSGGGGGDATWDPVITVRTSITAEGWFAEWRIPFSQLRYRNDAVQTWGLQLERKLRRIGEETLWAFRPRNEPQVVARYGHLYGLEGIAQGKRLELLPYSTARAEYRQIRQSAVAPFANPFRSGSEYFANMGLDLKYRVGTNLTLDAAVNPDFGQVELDPAVINLTAFETRFDEKRPFFVEGAEIFRFGDVGGRPGGTEAQLLYSRRIGRTPQGLTPSTAAYADVPGQTSIPVAVKLTGKNGSGWSVGLLDAFTDRVDAPWVDPVGTRGDVEVEPPTNYLAARLRRDVRQGTGSFGVMATSVHRALGSDALRSRLRSAAYAGGADAAIEARDLSWKLAGRLSASSVRGDAAAIARTQRSAARYMQRPDAHHMELDPDARSLSGLYGRLDLAKQTGTWQGNLGAAAITPGYEVNDLGFQDLADRVEVTGNFGYQKPRAGRHFRTLNLMAGGTNTVNFGGEAVVSEAELTFDTELASFNRFNAGVTRRFAAWDDRLTRGGPLTRRLSGWAANVGYNNDRRAKVQIRLGLRLDDEAGPGWARRANLGALFRIGDNFELDLGANVSREHVAAQYVTTVVDASATSTFGSRYVFAPLGQTTVGIESRFNVTFSPDLTFELYMQPLMSTGDYADLMELAAPRTFRFLRYGQDVGAVSRGSSDSFTVDPGSGAPSFTVADPDFNLHSLLGSAVLRWEWHPGSTLFLVWQQSRSERVMQSGSKSFDPGIGDFGLGRDVRELFDLKPDNVFGVKVTYWLNP